MSQPVAIYEVPPPKLYPFLTSHLPHSLPLLRRLQFCRFAGGITEHARVLWAASGGADPSGDVPPGTLFAAAYVDLSRGPETQMWLYSSLQSLPSPSEAEARAAGDQALALLREVRRVRDESRHGADEESRRPILLGTLSEMLRGVLTTRGCVFPYSSQWDKWMFRTDSLPTVAIDAQLEAEGLRWGKVRREDIAFVLSRTAIQRKERTVVLLPSKAITREDGTPIAWCFLGPDSSLTSLHCEEEYRGRGFAKAVAIKLMRDHLQDYGGDGLCSADVAPDNPSSQGVCRSLSGKIMWVVSWSTIDLDKIPGA
ncbi:hypothetical protein BJ170DRAFT_710613 [Xylariales sp. AK1849]|nr:hypothetical protein BJ170DRAFT_710613 [Xylariales sp. AK1849]